jgi:hypothetical protein
MDKLAAIQNTSKLNDFFAAILSTEEDFISLAPSMLSSKYMKEGPKPGQMVIKIMNTRST